jgi:glucan 1,3-beta-glucosidase
MQRDSRMSGKRRLLSRWDLLLTINICRIPIGYWSIPLTASDTSTSTSTAPYIEGAWTYFLRALAWAKKHNVRVIVDLHGAPGSQNGYDNSGQLTSNPVWAVNPDNVTRTVDTLKFLAKEVGNQVDVIELLNEAAGFRGDDWAAAVRSFWVAAYDAVRQAAGEDVKIMIGDAFLGVNVILSYCPSTEPCTSQFLFFIF